jgi:hypothetical protein
MILTTTGNSSSERRSNELLVIVVIGLGRGRLMLGSGESCSWGSHNDALGGSVDVVEEGGGCSVRCCCEQKEAHIVSL